MSLCKAFVPYKYWRNVIIPSRFATVYNPVVEKIAKKREAALLGGGLKRIESQHKKVKILEPVISFYVKLFHNYVLFTRRVININYVHNYELDV